MSFDQGFRAKGLAVLTLGLVFGSGLGIGLAWDRELIAGMPEVGEAVPEARSDTERRRGRRMMIVEQVGLSSEQKAAIDESVVVQRQRIKVIQEEFKAIERQFNQRYRGVLHDAREAIRDHLTDEQRSHYDGLLAEHDELRRQKREERKRNHPLP